MPSASLATLAAAGLGGAAAGAGAVYLLLRKPSRSAAKWASATLRWTGNGSEIHAEIRNPATPEPKSMTFCGLRPNPVEACLAAHGACCLIDVVDGCEKTGQLLSARCEVDSERATSAPRVIAGVHMTYVVETSGDAINEAMVSRLVEESNAGGSSVGGMIVGAGASLSWAVRIEKKA